MPLLDHFGTVWALPAFAVFTAAGISLAVIDVLTHRLPNRIVLPSFAAGVLLLALASLLSGGWGDLGRALVGSAALFAFYLVLAVASPRGMGMGDVKLAAVVGLHLAWLGWQALIVGAMAAFLLGGAFSAALVLSGRSARATRIPFGPWMIAGAVLGMLVGTDPAVLQPGAR